MTPAAGEAAGQLLEQYLALVGAVSSGSQIADKQDRKQQ
jgi:hypothetical protein